MTGAGPDPAAPSVPEGRLDGWERHETTSETVLDLGAAAVRTATVVYEDASLRARLREAAGLDRTWRFFFASRVAVPGVAPPAALRPLVTNNARQAFADRLRERGFDGVETAGRRELRIDGRAARATRYEATCRVEGVELDVEGWLVAWPDDDGGFLLAGGAYPRAVRTAPEGVGRTVGDHLDPAAFRTELFELVRATR
jgi:hypothetical protein